MPGYGSFSMQLLENPDHESFLVSPELFQVDPSLKKYERFKVYIKYMKAPVSGI
jgi:hypothetical protein